MFIPVYSAYIFSASNNKLVVKTTSKALEKISNTPKTGLELFRVCTEHLKGFVRSTIIADTIKKINKADSPKIKI